MLRVRSGFGIVMLLTVLFVSACASGGSDQSSPSAEGLDSASRLDNQQLMTLRGDELRRRSAAMGIASPPVVPLVRWTDLTNYAPTMVRCLKGSGFSATAVGGSGLEFGDIPQSQDNAYSLAIYTCTSKYTIHPYFNLPPSIAALEKMYTWYTGTSAPCLRSRGIDVPQPPTKDTWVEQYRNGQPSWLPWHTVPGPDSGGSSVSGWNELEQQCPQSPPADVYLEHVPAVAHGG